MAEQLAIIRGVGYGMRDWSVPILWFETYISEHKAALQIFEQPKANEIVQAASVYDVHKLEGRPCWVEVQAGTIKFIRMWEKDAR